MDPGLAPGPGREVRAVELADVSLDDKYTKADGRIFLTGIQALVRLPILQRQRDLAAGHDTAGYVTGYRGSPLGGLDQQLAAARRFLDQHHIKVQTAVNEDLAATALWGTQQAQLFGEGRYDGVFGMWYGKGPGVDRTGDAFRHGNLAGTAPLGGVLALMGDDHTCESSTTAHQSEYAMVDAMMPIANPAGVAEILQFGLLGFALSRYAGCWVGLKCVHDTVNTAASIDLEATGLEIRMPDDVELPPGGLSIRWPDTPLAQEERLHRYKLEAARAFARANRFDRLVLDSRRARLGIVTTGKSYLDVRQALDDLGIDRERAARLGLRVLKLGLVWPLDAGAVQAFARGLEQIVVVEEKRGLIETQLKELLYGRADTAIVGKQDEVGESLFPSHGALSSNRIARVLAERILRLDQDDRVAARLATLGQRDAAEARLKSPILRTPYFCPGCPHNTSTRVPEGSIAKAGIGCHYMAQWMDRSTAGFTQMGAEGANWIGEAPFSKRDHVFQNIGDGTYYHSGLLAIRAAVAAGVKVTYKILFNDAVAMTGGQQVDGPLSVPQISRQVLAEGVTQVVVVTDEPEKYPVRAGFGEGVTIRHRDELDDVQRTLREIEGTTVLIYDQTCAAEKRRRRKRGQMVDPERRVLINEAVCEGCGDCGLASNCAAIVPVETEFGRKRQIDQSSCNKDYSCLNGFCPSFVTVAGARLKKGGPTVEDDDQTALPEPALPDLAGGYGIVIGGVGGTGVVTIGALLGMAAHLEGKGAAVLDMTGLAQKGGAVMSHLRIAASPAAIQTVRIAPGGARLLLGCDLVVAGGKEALASLAPEYGHAVVNSHEMMTGDFTRNADLSLPTAALRQAIEQTAGERARFVPAT
ncbi:MAG: indolepyruvate ferredoxin oxidoreductase family protein, partial [Geminicoccaceae bacterium]